MVPMVSLRALSGYRRRSRLLVAAAALLLIAWAVATVPARAATQTLTVNNTTDSVNGTTYACPATNVKPCTLRLAIQVANSDTADTININSAMHSLSTGELQIRSAMTIVGTDPRNTIIDGSGQ